MSEEPTDPLGPLSTTPVPLVGADRVRARGRQRARRAQALLAGTGVLLVAALGGGAALLADRSGSTTLVPGATAPPIPTPTPEPTVTPGACDDEARCRPVPSDLMPTLFESPSPGSTADLPADTLVSETALDTTLAFGSSVSFVRYASSRSARPWFFTPCDAPVGEPFRSSYLEGSFQLQGDAGAVPEGPHVRQQISRLASPEAASAAATDFVAAVESCPTAPASRDYEGEPLGSVTTTVSNGIASKDPLVVAQFSLEPAYPWPTYRGVVVVEDLVSVWDFTPGELEDLAAALDVAGLVKAGLCRNTGTC